MAWEAARGAIYEHALPLDASTYHSDHWAEILSCRHDELPLYDDFLDWLYEQVHPEDREPLDRAYRDFIEGRTEADKVEVRRRHKQGHWLWIRGFPRP